MSPSVTSLVLALLGLAAVFWLLHENDTRTVLRTASAVGSGLVVVIAIRGLILATCGTGWWCLLRNFTAVPLRAAIGFRVIAEAINVMLPVATVGGDIVRAMLLRSRTGVDSGTAAASTLIDLLLQAAAQALFALFGVVLLARIAGGTELASWAAKGLGVAVLVLACFYAVQRFGGARLVERGLAAVARHWPAAAAGNALRLHERLKAIYADRRAVRMSFLLHEFGWLIGAFETFVALHLMHVPAAFSTALVLESLNQGLRTAAFPVPGALGVQEGAYIALGALSGIAPETALALSLVKRVPDLAIGLPGLLACYYLQIRRHVPRPVAATAASDTAVE